MELDKSNNINSHIVQKPAMSLVYFTSPQKLYVTEG